MVEKSAAAVQTAPSRPPVKAGKTESLSDRIDRLYSAISQRAFELFERDGRIDGNDQRHWLQAEGEFLHTMHVHLEETSDKFVVRAEVPGFTANDLEVNVEGRRLAITGKRESRKESKLGQKLYSEECADEIFRTIELPSDVNAAKVAATLKDGILDIEIPKAESQKSPAEEIPPA